MVIPPPQQQQQKKPLPVPPPPKKPAIAEAFPSPAEPSKEAPENDEPTPAPNPAQENEPVKEKISEGSSSVVITAGEGTPEPKGDADVAVNAEADAAVEENEDKDDILEDGGEEGEPVSDAVLSMLEAEEKTKSPPSPRENPGAEEAPKPPLVSRSFDLVKAQFDSEPLETGELLFKTGDVIKILNEMDAEWWLGELGGVQGWLPALFVVKITAANVEEVGTKDSVVEGETTLLCFLLSSVLILPLLSC